MSITKAYISGLTSGDELNARTIDAAMVLRFVRDLGDTALYPSLYNERLRRQLNIPNPYPWTSFPVYAVSADPTPVPNVSGVAADALELAEHCGVEVDVGDEDDAVAICIEIIHAAQDEMGIT